MMRREGLLAAAAGQGWEVQIRLKITGLNPPDEGDHGHFCWPKLRYGLDTARRHRTPTPMQMTATEALRCLKEGNARYVAGTPLRPNQCLERRKEVSEGQNPFAVVVGCSDSRAPAEILFDQGIGDLFVIRTAGHRVDDLAIASVEFAVHDLGVRLVVVMGHQSCGAISAAMKMPSVVEPWTEPGVIATNHIPRLLAKLQDVVQRSSMMPGDPVENAVKENTRTVMGVLMKNSSVLQEAASLDAFQIAGAYYSLDTGEVEWLE